MKLLICTMALLATGCFSHAGRDHRETAPVAGRLTLGGKPLQTGTQIVFSNEDDGFLFSGTTNEQGEFTLRSQFSGNGIPIGQYQVSLAPPPLPQATAMDLATKPGLLKLAKPDFPAKYHNSKTSGVAVEVELKKNFLELDLKP